MTEGISSTTNTTSAVKDKSAISQSVVGKDDFLKLLTYQLRSQNPLKPYDNQEFAAQLAQFSQLEQLVDIKALLDEQAYSNNLLTQTIANSALPGMIGKVAKAVTDNFKYDGSTKPVLGYDLTTNVQTGVMTVKDENGKVVKTIELSDNQLNQGNHQIEWDGTNDKGETVGAGKYYFSVEGKDKSNSAYTSLTSIVGKIEAVRFKSEGTMLVINGTEMALNTISDITGS